MARVFLFAEQVRSIVRSGGKEIEIAEGTRISSAAADLIKEHRLTVITVAPAKAAVSAGAEAGAVAAQARSSKKARKTSVTSEGMASHKPEPTAKRASASSGDFQVIAAEDLEAIVDRVIRRLRQLKAEQTPTKAAMPKVAVGTTAKMAAKTESGPDHPDDLVICRCEEITRAEIKSAIRNGMQTLNGIKRVTRAGMGLCQGQTCQRLVAQILTQELGISPAKIDPTTARGPVRPLRLGVFANN